MVSGQSTERLFACGLGRGPPSTTAPFLDVMFQPHLVDAGDPDYAEAATATTSTSTAPSSTSTALRTRKPGIPPPSPRWLGGAAHGLSVLWRQGALSRAAPFADAADLVDRVLPLLLGPARR